MTQRTRRFARFSAPDCAAQRQRVKPSARLTGTTPDFFCLTVLAVLAIFAPTAAVAVCTPDPPMDNDTVTCTDEISTGYDVSGAENLDISIEGNSVFDDTGVGLDSAIRIGNETSLNIGEDSILNVTIDGQFGIQGDDNNFVRNDGTISVSGEGARGISLDNNTSGVLPNGGVNGATGQIFVSGDDSIALEGGENSGLATSGLIDLTGDRTIGVSAGSRVNLNSAANLTNAAGTINVSGSDAYGIKAGDDWIDGSSASGSFVPESAGIRNLTDNTNPSDPIVADINVSGDRATGIFAGDETNLTGDNNSFVANGPLANITVTGEDAIAISVGGNNRLDSNDASLDTLYSVANGGRITGDEDAGTLIEIRTFVSGFENRILNDSTGEILADTTNLGTFNRGIAISGTAGEDLLENLGDITGDVLFGDGDDQYLHGAEATFQDSLRLGDGDNRFENLGTFGGSVIFGTGEDTAINAGTFESNLDLGDGNDRAENLGTIDGDVLLGAGNDTYSHGPEASVSGSISGGSDVDTIELRSFSDADPRTFDLSTTSNFETLRLEAGSFQGAWILEGTADFSGLTEILDGAILRVDTPTVFAGDLDFSDSAGLILTLDGSGTPITVQGDATFDGEVLVEVDPSDLTTDTTYRVVDVLGSYTGEFDEIRFGAASAAFAFTESYDAMGLAVFFEALGLAALAQGDSQIALANYLDLVNAEGGATSDLQTLIDGLLSETGSAANVLISLLPEAYDVHTTISAEAGRRLTHFLFDRPRECQATDRNRWITPDAKIPCHARAWSPWVSAIGSMRNRDGFAGHPEYAAQMGGLVLGFDTRPLAGIDFTFALSTQSGTIDVDGSGTSGLTLIDLTGQAAWNYGPLRAQGAATWGHGFHEDSRRVRFQDPGPSSTTQTSRRGETDHESDRVTLAAEIGVVLQAGPVNIEPLASADWTWINQEEIKEGGNVGGLGVQIAERDEEIASVSGGVRVSTVYEQSRYIAQQLEWMDGVWRPQIDVRWRQILSGYDRSIRSRLRGAPDTAGRFSIDGKEDKGGFEIGAGLSFVPEYANRLQIDLQYQAFVASHTLDQDLVARVTLGF